MSTAGSDLAPGVLLSGRYRVDGVLGRGGMSIVYRARDETLGRDVAIKAFHPTSADAAALERRRVEVRLLAGFNHPALVTLFDVGSVGQVSYLVMELVSGTDLRGRLDAGRPSPAETAQIGADLADALAYIHARGVVHRDLKPSNVLLPPPGATARTRAKLADFGIARIVDAATITASGTMLGTASYLSPEQAQGLPVTAATDVYALGLVLLESLTGERAFPGPAAESAMARLASDPVVPDWLGPEWGGLLRQMTARDPERRPSAASAAHRLEAARDFTPPDREENRIGATLGQGWRDASTHPQATHAAPVVTAATRALPAAAMTTATTQLGTQAATPPVPATPIAPRRSRRAAVIVALVAAAAAVAIGLVVWLPVLMPAPPTHTPPAYPSVSGQLGEHLTQLQDAIAP